MKFKTIIELICDAADKDDAMNIAGDYLRGEEDFGVRSMRCTTISLRTQRVIRYTATSLVALLFFSVLICRFISQEKGAEFCSQRSVGRGSTYTVVPELKTGNDEDFKADWEKKKDAAVLEYLKK